MIVNYYILSINYEKHTILSLLIYFIWVTFFFHMKLIQNHLFLTYWAVFLLSQPILYTITVMNMLTFQDGNILPFIYLVIAYTTDLFRESLLLIFRIDGVLYDDLLIGWQIIVILTKTKLIVCKGFIFNTTYHIIFLLLFFRIELDFW